MNTIGMGIPETARYSASPNPDIPGRWMSSTKQAVWAQQSASRNSLAVAYVSTIKPADCNSRCNAQRTEASSSITTIAGAVWRIGASALCDGSSTYGARLLHKAQL